MALSPFSRTWMDAALEKRPTKPSIQQNYMGHTFFPLKRVWEYELTWDLVKAANHLAGVYAHDGVPIPGNDPDYENLATDVMHMMASRIISPGIVMKLRQAGELPINNQLVRSARARLLTHIGTRLASCQDEIEAEAEYLCMHALQGEIRWPPRNWDESAITPAPAYWGDVAFVMSMGYGATFTQDASTLVGHNARAGGGAVWSDYTNSNPILDLEVIAEYINEQTGLNAWGAKILMSRTLLSHMAQNAQVLRWIRGDTGSPPDSMTRFINQADLKAYIQTKLGYEIVLYDSQWTYESNLSSASGPTETRIKFLKEGRCIILPQGVVGSGITYFATAPDLGAPDGENLGLYTWSAGMDRPPWTTEVGAGIHGFPIMKMTEGIFILDALD